MNCAFLTLTIWSLTKSEGMKLKRLYSYLVVGLAVAELLLVLLSWLLSATMTEGVRSMLSGEGVRWFFGSFVSVLSSQWLVWLLLLSMSGGCLWKSGLLSVFRSGVSQPLRSFSYRQRVALRSAVVTGTLYVVVVMALTVVPHAVLLSATGQLFPSAFSRALVPIIAFGVSLVSAVYGLMSGRFGTLYDVVSSLSFGITKTAPLFVLYVVLMQFLASLRFVFC